MASTSCGRELAAGAAVPAPAHTTSHGRSPTAGDPVVTRLEDHAARHRSPGERADRDLALRFGSGDTDAMRELYDRYSGPIYTVALSRLSRRDLAEEAMQETLVKAWRAAATFDPARDLSPWLYQIARRTAADIARRERRRPNTTELNTDLGADEPVSMSATWEAWQVRCALDDLPADERELIRLSHFQGMTRSQIAEHLGLPIGTVKSRVHRVHRRLAARLGHLRDE